MLIAAGTHSGNWRRHIKTESESEKGRFQQTDSKASKSSFGAGGPTQQSRHPAKVRPNTDDYVLIMGTLHHKHLTSPKVFSGVPSDHEELD